MFSRHADSPEPKKSRLLTRPTFRTCYRLGMRLSYLALTPGPLTFVFPWKNNCWPLAVFRAYLPNGQPFPKVVGRYGQPGCNREKFGGVERLFAVLLVLLNCLTESTFPSPSSEFKKFWGGGGETQLGVGDPRATPPLYETLPTIYLHR